MGQCFCTRSSANVEEVQKDNLLEKSAKTKVDEKVSVKDTPGEPVVIRAVRGDKFCAWVRGHDLFQQLQKSSEGGGLVSEDFVKLFVMPVCTEKSARLFDLLPDDMTIQRTFETADRPPDNEGKEKEPFHYVFVSHAWKRPVAELLNYVDTDKWFWIDMISVSQIRGEEQAADLGSIAQLVSQSKELWALLDDAGLLFSRAWCMYEICNRILVKRQVHFEVPQLLQRLGLVEKPEEEWNVKEYCFEYRKLLQEVLDRGVDVRKTQALYERDRRDILKWVEDNVGFDEATRMVIENVTTRMEELEKIAELQG
eukprot:gb/GEZN01008840.1/.p1 GENE.gb/GEZN01008840.1/~~gb/GEZN01008840.1/.p1  ORF type:complete len:311 (-),score=57.75 gb/GEZN01008840.1/:11-943(-)